MRSSTKWTSTWTWVGGAALACSFATAAFAGGDWSDREFKMMDSNGDGKISREEHAAGAKAMFDKMDENKDGKVTSAEMDGAHEKMTGAKASKTDMSSIDKIKMVDTNNDGVLSADEHAAGAKTMFDAMDTDHDGYLSKSELAEGHARMMAGHNKPSAK